MYKDLTGEKYNRLLVLQRFGTNGIGRGVLWECLCDCGNKTIVRSGDLTKGHTKSCGCLRRERVSQARKKHGDRGGRLYAVWRTMRRRCENPKHRDYEWYGAKGVKVCDEWQDYSTFKEWSIANGYDITAPKGKCTIDRIDPYGIYEPSNCRWVSMKEQNANKRKQNPRNGE